MALAKRKLRKVRVALAVGYFALAVAATAYLGRGLLLGGQLGSPNIEPRADYREVVGALTPLIEHDLKEKGIPSIAVALVDDQQIVWAQGFGFADPASKVEATAATV